MPATPDAPLPLDPHALDGYGLGGRHGCVINLDDITLRAGALATGLIWSAPVGAQEQAVLDMASGRIERPTYPLPEWASNALAYYEEHGLAAEVTNNRRQRRGRQRT